jgi:hypothetical protein
MKWFYLGEDGNIHYLGIFEIIDDADYYITERGIVAIWIFSEKTAKQWNEQLTYHLK